MTTELPSEKKDNKTRIDRGDGFDLECPECGSIEFALNLDGDEEENPSATCLRCGENIELPND